MFKKILVPIDGSDLSSIAVREACTFAKAIGAHLSFFYARPSYMPGYVSGEMVIGAVDADETFNIAMKQQAMDILAKASQIATEVGIEHATLSDEYSVPYQGIIETAQSNDSDLIFMASHGRHGLGAMLLGSETQKVLTHCKIPVLVFR